MRVSFISVPYDLGRYKIGHGQGPGSVLETGIGRRLADSGHTVDVQVVKYPKGQTLTDIQSAFTLNSLLSDAVAMTVESGSFPIVLAGNCISAAGTLSGLKSKRTGILWLDAHADFNTPETTLSGYLDGMALSVASGHCWKNLASVNRSFHAVPEDSIVLIGTRDVDPAEAALVQKSKMKVVSADQLRLSNFSLPVTARPYARDLYVHMDADVLDKSVGRANEFASRNGLFPIEIVDLLYTIEQEYDIKAFAITAYGPQYDKKGTIRETLKVIISSVVKAVSEKGKKRASE